MSVRLVAVAVVQHPDHAPGADVDQQEIVAVTDPLLEAASAGQLILVRIPDVVALRIEERTQLEADPDRAIIPVAIRGAVAEVVATIAPVFAELLPGALQFAALATNVLTIAVAARIAQVFALLANFAAILADFASRLGGSHRRDGGGGHEAEDDQFTHGEMLRCCLGRFGLENQLAESR